MEEYVNKVKLNLDIYTGDDAYSDGDIEDEILSIVQSEEDLEEHLTHDNRWAVLYHLSTIRHNLLEWYDFDPEASLLEIGSGCGAMSGLFARKCRQVTGVELSKRRSLINANRNRDCDNLEIRVGNFRDMEFTEQYDYVTLIGVLEYSPGYVGGDAPFGTMLKKAHSLLKPGGVLITAIENKFGLKYWAGASEDHTGRAFDGIEGYPGVDFVRTFSRSELEKLMVDAGFEHNEFYYPYPDYKMPREVYSQDYLPAPGSITTPAPAYDRERYQVFDEVRVMNELLREGMFPFFSNSFLVFSKKD
ncbi:MAG: class I SAM-dependent methyltransferase [Eubacterium sp.]|nr:class I SAM-dependent methyltransferase [Eubacterium sp.]